MKMNFIVVVFKLVGGLGRLAVHYLHKVKCVEIFLELKSAEANI